MSKELEALGRFYFYAVVYSDCLYGCDLLGDKSYRKRIEHIDKDYDLLKQALKRNEPMKIKLVSISGCKSYDCSNCGSMLAMTFDGLKQNYCDTCGQKLDWSEVK